MEIKIQSKIPYDKVLKPACLMDCKLINEPILNKATTINCFEIPCKI